MTESRKSSALNISLWVVQVLLALLFIIAGSMKAFQPIENIAESLPWVLDTPALLVRFIGISEILGAVGLILPAILKIRPILTGYAAIGLILIMIGAMGFHGMRGEYASIGFNLVLILLATFVAWGRLKKLPIVAR